MNHKMVFYMIGQITKLEAVALLLPAIVALIYSESCGWIYLLTAVSAAALGFALTTIFKKRNNVIFAKDGFVIVALSWIVLSLIGALPFTLSGEIPSYVDAVFETVSGFTTTGASILSAPQALSHAAMFWRSFTHWMGGMGIIVLVMAVMRTVTGRSMHILRAEVPGPTVDKLVPKIRETAKILYLIYIAITVLMMIVLIAFGMPVFESIVHAIGTAGTGGFGIKADSIGSYSPALQWVIAIFMLAFGINFNIYYLILRRRIGAALKSTEMWVYIGIVLASSLVITANVFPIYKGVWESLRQAVFQVSTVITTTGFSTTDFNLWPTLSKGILLVLMFMGGCAGSTAGGLKVSRVVLMFKIIKRELHHILHPRSVYTVKMEGKTVNDETLRGISSYFVLYVIMFITIFLLLCLEPFSIEGNFSAAVACFNNIGPAFAEFGPMSNYAAYSDFSKILLSFAMLLGRLEIYPILFVLIPSTWTKK